MGQFAEAFEWTWSVSAGVVCADGAVSAPALEDSGRNHSLWRTADVHHVEREVPNDELFTASDFPVHDAPRRRWLGGGGTCEQSD